MSSRVSSLQRHCQTFAFGQRSGPWSVPVGFIREQPRVSCPSPRTWPNSWASERAATYGLQNGAPSSRLKIQMRACGVYPTVASALIVQPRRGMLDADVRLRRRSGDEPDARAARVPRVGGPLHRPGLVGGGVVVADHPAGPGAAVRDVRVGAAGEDVAASRLRQAHDPHRPLLRRESRLGLSPSGQAARRPRRRDELGGQQAGEVRPQFLLEAHASRAGGGRASGRASRGGGGAGHRRARDSWWRRRGA